MPGTVDEFTAAANTPVEHKGLRTGVAQVKGFQTFPLTMLTTLTISKSHASARRSGVPPSNKEFEGLSPARSFRAWPSSFGVFRPRIQVFNPSGHAP